jgi:hypothetical protein
MEVWEIIFGVWLWSLVGFIAWIILGSCFNVRVIEYAFGIEFVNPLVIYKRTKVNWFGAILLAIIYGMMCPIATFVYWLYKLCTVGRK